MQGNNSDYKCFRSFFKTIYITLYIKERKKMDYLTTYSTHFIYGCMLSDIWQITIQIVREETRCRYMDYSFRLAAMVLWYAPSHGLCYTSPRALAWTRNSSEGPPRRINPTTHRTTFTSRSLYIEGVNCFPIDWYYLFSKFVFVSYFFCGSSHRSFMVNPLSYFSFQPVLHDWRNKVRCMCYPVCVMLDIK